MKCKQLYILPVAPPPAMQIPPCTTNIGEHSDGTTYTYTTLHYKYTVRTVTVEKTMLEVTAYSYDGIPLWRTWQTEEQVEGQKLCQPPKPMTSTIGTLTSYDTRGIFFTDPESEKTARDWMRNNTYPMPTPSLWREGEGSAQQTLDMLAKSQTTARHKKRDEKRNRIRREVDNAMLEIREPPKAFERWVLHDALANYHYIVYQYTPKKAKPPGYCTRCQHEVTVAGPRHMAKGRCPRCHSPITYMAQGKLAVMNGIRHHIRVAYLQSIAGGFCIRSFSVTMQLNKDNYRAPKLELFENGRTFCQFDAEHYSSSFYWGEPWPNTCHGWCKGSEHTSHCDSIYPSNLTDLFRNTSWRYLPMAQMARQIRNIAPWQFVRLSKLDKAVEHLAKHGFWNLVHSRLDGREVGWGPWYRQSRQATDIRQALGGLRMDEIKLLQALNPTALDLRLYRVLREHSTVSRQTMATCIENGFNSRADALETLLAHTTLHRILRYCKEQFALCTAQGKTPGGVLGDWRDYLSDAAKLGWDVKSEFVLFPRALQEAHRQSIEAVRQVADRKKNQLIAATLKKQKHLEYKYGDFLIRLPATTNEIKAEGKALNHCVGGYVDRVVDGKTVIMFIRRCEQPKKPFYTLELDPETLTVSQVRGLRNCATTPEVQKFLARWEKRLETFDKKRQRLEVTA